MLRAGFGLFYNDLAQGGWAPAFQAVNNASAGQCCLNAGDPGAVIDPNYKTPYAIHASAGVQHAINPTLDLERRLHARTGESLAIAATITRPGVNIDANAPALAVFRSDNRSSFDSLAIVLQGNVTQRFNLIAHYTLANAKTWGCVLGELFDYVNGVCDPLNPFGPGDYGPSGEDIRHRFVLGGMFHTPGGFELSTLTQAESARPFTLTTPAGDRAVVNGVKTSLDQVRGTPYIQIDLRVSRP